MKEKKNFWDWMLLKGRLHERDTSGVFFREREVWWCALGTNVGHEQDGTGRRFDRPVVVLKKFNRYVFLGITLTTRPKAGPYYFPVGKVGGRDNTAILSQVRLMDRKRLLDKVDTLSTPNGSFPVFYALPRGEERARRPFVFPVYAYLIICQTQDRKNIY